MKRRHSADHAEKRNAAMDMATSCVATNICASLSGNEIDSMSQTNRAWWHFVANNRHRLAKKQVQLNIIRRNHSKEQEFEYFEGFEKKSYRVPSVCRQEVQVHFMIEQAGSQRHYGVILREFIPRLHQAFKSVDPFDPCDLNQLSMDSDYHLEIKAVESLEENLHTLVRSLANKVNFKCLVLIDPTSADLQALTEIFRSNWTIIERLHIRLTGTSIPTELVHLMRIARGCKDIKIIADRATHLQMDLLTCDSIQNAKSLDVHLGHFSAVYHTNHEEHDQAIGSLKADTLRLRGVLLTSGGANQLIKQWIDKKRGEEGNRTLDINIAADVSQFKKESVFDGIEYEARDQRSHDQYIICRPGKRGVEQIVVSFIGGRFTMESYLPETEDKQRLWF